MYRQLTGSGFSVRILWRIGRIAASVFPIPVGAMTRTLFPAMIRGTARRWGSVNSWNPSFRSASRIGG